MTSQMQRTIAQPVSVSGFGYWSGQDVRVEFRPAPAGTGIRFYRQDLPGQPDTPALVTYRQEIPRRSSLQRGQAEVQMVEHVLAALYGLEIDNCQVWVNAAEMPGLDGSAQPFVEALRQAGEVVQPACRPTKAVSERVRLTAGDSWIEARPSPTGQTLVEYHLDYGPGNPIGRQSFRTTLTPETFCQQIAPARTFLLRQEAEAFLSRGMGLRTRPEDLLVFDEDGPIGNRLRFPEECARHKLLDLIGDLALAGCRLVGEFVAFRSGHRLNAELVQFLQTVGNESRQCIKRCA
ncbi:MAG TPA: UDP-3-O-acyl-N-acetylglucosamine deacetylase [Thermoguttaceae bacterium]|nr:UDP-3-O-acyl-N-acetylglucosamine deacetylase [Thermoguttaceae bacterium]